MVPVSTHQSLIDCTRAWCRRYGYSLQAQGEKHSGSRLVVWEAQFGDFANGAQVIQTFYCDPSLLRALLSTLSASLAAACACRGVFLLLCLVDTLHTLSEANSSIADQYP